jgi:hypothetical protein
MHLQLTGRLDPGEQFATVNLDGVDLFMGGQKMINLSLLSAFFCHQTGHTHFPNPVKALYPVDPSRYPETITVQRQSRSASNDEDDDNDDDDDDDDDVNSLLPKRIKRSAEEDSVTAHAAAAAGHRQILPMEVRYYAGFRNTTFDFVVDNFRDESPKTLIESVLGKKQSEAASNHFQQLLAHPIKYALLAATAGADTSRQFKQVQITLPPLTRFLCSDKKFFTLLGFSEASQPSQIIGKTIWYLENSSRTETKIFLGSTAINPNLKFNFHMPKSKPANSYTIHVQRLEPNFSTVLTLDSFCQQSPTATLKFFKLILEGTIEILGLPIDCLQATLLTSDVIALKKADALQSDNDAADNFHLSIQLGSHILSLLGVALNPIAWSLPQTVEIKMSPLTETLSSEAEERCQHVLDSLPTMFLNQTSDNEIVKSWQTRWQQYLSDMESATAAAAVAAAAAAAAADETNVKEDGDGVSITSSSDETIENIPQNVVPPTTTSETTTSTTTTTTTTASTSTSTSTSTTTTTTVTIAQPPSIPEILKPPTPPPSRPSVSTIVINNPARRPPRDYIVANSTLPHICTNPLSFPDNCTLIVREGEPTDYLANRGYCSVLGLVRKEKQPNILSNGCVLRAGQNLNSLSIEIVDDAFNAYRITGEKSMWIKIDLQCTALHKSSIF